MTVEERLEKLENLLMALVERQQPNTTAQLTP